VTTTENDTQWEIEIEDDEERVFVLPLDPITVRRFVHAATGSDPVYFDDEAARAAGYERAIAPPTFVSSMLDYTDGPPEDELREDGVAMGLFPSIVQDDALLMGGGQDIEILAPMYQGDTITVTRRTARAYRRPSNRFGELTFVVETSDGVNQSGQPVVRITDTLIVKQ
jgi:acyl dehydratase